MEFFTPSENQTCEILYNETSDGDCIRQMGFIWIDDCFYIDDFHNKNNFNRYLKPWIGSYKKLAGYEENYNSWFIHW